jgi:transcription initiation factor TFIIF subunit beta
MDSAMKDEEKPFDLAAVAPEDDLQPDPDEHIILDSGSGRVWLVKVRPRAAVCSPLARRHALRRQVPKFLMERWAGLEEDGLELATIRIYDDKSRGAHAPPRMFVEAPADPKDPSQGKDLYELDMNNQDVENQIVIAERAKDPSQPTNRARTTIMTGKVKHECNLRPVFSERYRERVKRAMNSSLPTKRTRLIGEVAKGSAGQMAVNRLTSGVTSAAGFQDISVRHPARCPAFSCSSASPAQRNRQKQPKGGFERMARMARNQLLDLLFSLFKERDYWPIRMLRERTQQPEAYLKEILGEIATLHRSGEHNGMWELKAAFRDGVRGARFHPPRALAYGSLQAKNEATEELYKMEPPEAGMFAEEEEEDEDEDEDDDMEEVS